MITRVPNTLWTNGPDDLRANGYRNHEPQHTRKAFLRTPILAPTPTSGARMRRHSGELVTTVQPAVRGSDFQGPQLRPFLSERMRENAHLETYREKVLKCIRAADTVRYSETRAELLRLASIYLLLADYIDRQRERSAAHRRDQDQDCGALPRSVVPPPK